MHASVGIAPNGCKLVGLHNLLHAAFHNWLNGLLEYLGRLHSIYARQKLIRSILDRQIIGNRLSCLLGDISLDVFISSQWRDRIDIGVGIGNGVREPQGKYAYKYEQQGDTAKNGSEKCAPKMMFFVCEV